MGTKFWIAHNPLYLRTFHAIDSKNCSKSETLNPSNGTVAESSYGRGFNAGRCLGSASICILLAFHDEHEELIGARGRQILRPIEPRVAASGASSRAEAPPVEHERAARTCRQERDSTAHVPLLSHFTCGWQLRYPAESTSDGVLARDTSRPRRQGPGLKGSARARGRGSIGRGRSPGSGHRARQDLRRRGRGEGACRLESPCRRASRSWRHWC
jgi:hypothetical protein